MPDFNTYLHAFFAIGSKGTVRKNRKSLLENMVSCVPHTLTTPQKVQARNNIGIDLLYKTGQMVWLTKGEHDVNFTVAFTDNYVVFAQGTTGTSSFNPILDPAKFYPAKFVVKMPVDGYLIWRAELITEL